jgi:hypothetical protein
MRGGAAQGARGPRDARRGGNSGRSPGPGRGRLGQWGALQGGLGVCIIVASAAVGAIATMVTHGSPGSLLGLFVVAGTVAAALVIRPRDGRMILPVPALAYLVAALASGVVSDRPADSSRTALAIAAAQWAANGFFAMALATILAAAIITARWYLWRRSRPARRAADWGVPAGDATRPAATRAVTTRPGTARAGTARPGTGRRPGEAWETSTESGYPGGFAGTGSPRESGETGGTGSRGAGPRDTGPRDTGPRTGPRPGSGPYNFSSGA